MADQIHEIGERLRRIRDAKKMNQATFCRLVKIEQQAWNNYERGARRISLDQALKVCQFTGATLDYIYRGIEASLPYELAVALQSVEQAPAQRKTR